MLDCGQQLSASKHHIGTVADLSFSYIYRVKLTISYMNIMSHVTFKMKFLCVMEITVYQRFGGKAIRVTWK